MTHFSLVEAVLTLLDKTTSDLDGYENQRGIQRTQRRVQSGSSGHDRCLQRSRAMLQFCRDAETSTSPRSRACPSKGRWSTRNGSSTKSLLTWLCRQTSNCGPPRLGDTTMIQVHFIEEEEVPLRGVLHGLGEDEGDYRRVSRHEGEAHIRENVSILQRFATPDNQGCRAYIWFDVSRIINELIAER